MTEEWITITEAAKREGITEAEMMTRCEPDNRTGIFYASILQPIPGRPELDWEKLVWVKSLVSNQKSQIRNQKSEIKKP